MNQVAMDLQTRESQARRILKFLKLKGRITNVEMVRMRILRGSERIRELKADGYIIVTNHVKGGIWEYVYKGHEDDDDEPPHKEFDSGL